MMRPEYGYASKDCRVLPPQGGPRDAEYIFDMHLINWVSRCALHGWPVPHCQSWVCTASLRACQCTALGVHVKCPTLHGRSSPSTASIGMRLSTIDRSR